MDYIVNCYDLLKIWLSNNVLLRLRLLIIEIYLFYTVKPKIIVFSMIYRILWSNQVGPIIFLQWKIKENILDKGKVFISRTVNSYNWISYKKVTVRLSVCLFEPKDLANRWTNMVLLYRVDSYRSWECYTFSF